MFNTRVPVLLVDVEQGIMDTAACNITVLEGAEKLCLLTFSLKPEMTGL